MLMNLKEFREYPDRLSDLLPWVALVAPGIILNKDGSFLTSFSYRSFDLNSATDAELVAVSERLNNILKRLGSGWCLYAESKRIKKSGYIEGSFPNSLSQALDDERRKLFENTPYYENENYLTLIYLPESDTKNKLAELFLENRGENKLENKAENRSKNRANYEGVLERFIEETESFYGLLKGIFLEIKRLSDSELLSYLHSSVSTKVQSVRVPECPMYLDSLLADTAILGGMTPKLGKKYIKVISIKNYPPISTPCLFDSLNKLGFEYRFTTRFIFLDKVEAESEINKLKKRWFSKRKGVVTLLKETLTGTESVMEDSDAIRKTHDADDANRELLNDEVSYGYYTFSLVLMDEDIDALSEMVKSVERTINSLGFISKAEDINSLDTWLSSIPGNVRNNVRRPLLHTKNLSHLLPISSVYSGPTKNTHLNAGPLLIAKNVEGGVFRLTNHVNDVGHTLIIGPTGSGKSVLLNTIEAQFLRYKDARIFIFDKGKSSRILTEGVGGNFYELGRNDNGLSFQPLKYCDDVSERRFLAEWLIDILTQENVKVTPAIKEEVWVALTSLGSAPKKERTLFGLTVLLQNEELRQALRPFTIHGQGGNILDSDTNSFSIANFQSFEMETLMETPSMVMPVLSYLFFRLEKSFRGAPVLLVLDEAWLYLDNEAFSKKIKEWLKVLRKKNVSVIFATQSLTDISQSNISMAIKDSCFTKIYLSDGNALSDDSSSFYRSFGLNQREVEIISQMIPKKEYFYTSPMGRSVFDLCLGPLQLEYLARTSVGDINSSF